MDIGSLIAEIKQRPMVAGGAVLAGGAVAVLAFRGRAGGKAESAAPEVFDVAPDWYGYSPYPPLPDISGPTTPAPTNPPQSAPVVKRKVAPEMRRIYDCEPLSKLTYERNGSGNIVCERRDGVQYPVKIKGGKK